MKIGAYQFAVTGSIEQNFQQIKQAIMQASQDGVELLLFPECALTGYPPRDIGHSSDVNFRQVSACCNELDGLADNCGISFVVGAITEQNGEYYNSAIVFSPNHNHSIYNKRALWGWDRDNFVTDEQKGVFEANGFKIGIRICFEVRFPEYFRELYLEKTDLNLILFYDVADCDDMERYDLIKGHIRTRAVENVCYTLTANSIYPYQTAPTALYDKSGRALCELERNKAGLLIYDLDMSKLDYGEQGRRDISNQLLKI